MAAITVFHSGAAGTWVAAQFTDNTGGVPADAPGTGSDGDILILDGRMGGALTSQPGDLTMARLTQYANAPYAFGSSSSPILISPVLLELGVPSPDGSNATPASFSINVSGGACAAKIFSTAQVGTSNVAPCLLRGSSAMTVDVIGPNCKVGIGMNMPNTVAGVTRLSVTEDARGRRVEVGAGNTGLVNAYLDEGETILNCAVTNLYIGPRATCRTEGAAAIGTIYCSGKLVANSTGTITALNVESGGVADFEQSNAARTVSAATVNGTGRIKANGVFVTWPTAGVQCLRGAHTSQVDYGENLYVYFTAAGAAVIIEAHTSGDTLTANESGTTHTNLGAGATVTLVLPSAAPAGTWFRFCVSAAFELRIDPGGSDAFFWNGAKQADGKYLTADDEAEHVTVMADANGDWITGPINGTWAVEV